MTFLHCLEEMSPGWTSEQAEIWRGNIPQAVCHYSLLVFWQYLNYQVLRDDNYYVIVAISLHPCMRTFFLVHVDLQHVFGAFLGFFWSVIRSPLIVLHNMVRNDPPQL